MVDYFSDSTATFFCRVSGTGGEGRCNKDDHRR
jgi:hypothetical protein